MSIQFTKANPIGTPDAVENFEKTERIKLPDDYRHFLLNTNGGCIDYGFIEYEHPKLGKTRETIYQFYGLAVKDKILHTGDLSEVRKSLKQYFPDDLLVIAKVVGGHLHVVMSLSSEGFGNVYFWLDSSGRDKFEYHVSSSFSGFLEQLRFDDEELSMSD